MLALKIRPLEDELLYSYLYRLALADGVSFGRLSQFIMGGHLNSYDISRRLDKFFDMFSFDNPDKLFLDTSTMLFESIAWTESQRGKYVNNCFRDIGIVNSPTKRLIDNVRICPVCSALDKERCGLEVFYRSHNLTGVSVCWKHKTALLESVNSMPFVDGRVREYRQLRVDDMSLEHRYALFAHKVLKAGLDLTLDDTSRILTDKLKDVGITTNEAFADRFGRSKYSKLYVGKTPIGKFFSYMQWSRTVLTQALVSVLIFAYDNKVDYFIADCVKQGLNRPIIHLVSHSCGVKYVITRWGEKVGFRCPLCDNDEKALAVRLVKNIGGGMYEFKGSVSSADAKTEFIHKSCGAVARIKLSSFLYGGTRCRCERMISRSEAERRVAGFGDYELVDFPPTPRKCTIRHLVCGGLFRAEYHRFTAKPNCSLCNGKPDLEVYRKRLTEVCGNEYSLLDTDIGYHRKISIKHNVCGHVHSYYMLRFMKGQRCPYCNRNSAVKEVYSSLKATYGINDIILAEDIEVEGLDKDSVGSAVFRLVHTNKLRSIGIGCYVFAENKADITDRRIIEAKYILRNGRLVGYYALGYGSSIRIYTTMTTYDLWDKRVQGNTLYYVCACRVRELNDDNIRFLPILGRLSNQRLSKSELERLVATLNEMGLSDCELEKYLKIYPEIVRERLKKGSNENE